MAETSPLPPGQRELPNFPGFGFSRLARRAPHEGTELILELSGDDGGSDRVRAGELDALPRVEQVSDFHCVTTWSRRNLRWGGFRFRDFYESILVPRVSPSPKAQFVIFHGSDGYATSLLLHDALAEDVLLADTLDGEPLSVEHGAPMRIVAPAHYGYKNAKHLAGIEVRRDRRIRRPFIYRLIDHPRGRVAFEERGVGAPGWLLRYAYRPMIKNTIRKHRRALSSRSDERGR